MPLLPLIAGFLALALVAGAVPPELLDAREAVETAALAAAQLDAPDTAQATLADARARLAETEQRFPDLTITPHLPGAESFYSDDLDLRFFSALMTFVSVGVFHLFACCAVAALMFLRISQMPRPVKRQALIVLGLTFALLVVINMIARQPSMIGALTLTYRNICAVVIEGGVVPHLMPQSCTGAGISPFAWLALLPYIAGILAAATASAVTCMAYRPVVSGDVAAELERRGKVVEQAFQGTAFVLVTSTLTMMLFYQLPLSLIVEGSPASERMTGYAQGMALFWGVLFTLTIATVFGPGGVLLQRQLRARHPQVSLPEAMAGQTARKQLIGTLTTLAPLLIGASGSVLEQLAGAL